MRPSAPDATPMPDAKAEDVERLEAERDARVEGEGREPGEEG
jgi:hypothetical protein